MSLSQSEGVGSWELGVAIPSSTTPHSPLPIPFLLSQGKSPGEIQQPELREEEEEEKGELKEEPKGQENPFLQPELEDLIEKQISEDLWETLKGELPCVQATTDCIAQLQNNAIKTSNLLAEIDSKINEAITRIDEAKRRNLDSIALSTFSPFLQTFLYSSLGPVSNGVETPVQNPFRLIFGNLGAALLGQGLGAIFNWSSLNANDAQLSRSIAISDLQIKVAELQRNKAEIADKLRERVTMEALKLEEIARDFQIEKEIAKREKQRLEISKVSYRFGEGDSKQYLAELSAYDRQKATTWKQWARLRSQLTLVKILVIGDREE